MKKLLIATSNQGKLAEYREIFQALMPELELMSLNDLGISGGPEEDGETFEENAEKKARFYYDLAKMPLLADDGGIEIEYLNGEPGVRSRRWPGHEATDEELVQMTMEKLKGVPEKNRGAQLTAAISFMTGPQEIHTFRGVWKGHIVEERSKTAKLIPGYPYRSLFYIPESGTILGEIPFEEEVKLGHRRKALEKSLPILKKFFS